ncbi:MAG: hypothetical protein ACTSUT_03150 [Promethearchaeota archaeon]
MEKEEAQKNFASDIKHKQNIHCSKCDKIISKGEYYTRDILTKEITYMECEDNRIYLNDENFMAIDKK